MRVLITGCAGFIGSNLADRLLSRGHTMSASTTAYGMQSQIPDGVEFHAMDIRDRALRSICSGVMLCFTWLPKTA